MLLCSPFFTYYPCLLTQLERLGDMLAVEMKIRDGAELMLDVRTKVNTVPLPFIRLPKSRNAHIYLTI
jgi:hypothetical protein